MCLTDGSLPIRLSREPAGWELELYQLVAVARDVYRPRRVRITGERAIVRHLRERDLRGGLARTTEMLMQCFPKCEGHFVAINGEWSLVEPARRLTLVRAKEAFVPAELVPELAAEPG